MRNRLFLCSWIIAFPAMASGWGFYGHRFINQQAVFLLPPEMLIFYKPKLHYITDHAVDPDMRRYVLKTEGAHHYIDIDLYGRYPFRELPRNWDSAVARYSTDTLQARGIVPWWIQIMLARLTQAFRDKNEARILRYSADIGHYIADAHVPLHACSNHNGQATGQQGIHGFWESRVPELLAEKEWDFVIGKAAYIQNPSAFIWQRVLESAAAADSVLAIEKKLSALFRPDQKYAFEDRNGVVVRQYSSAYCRAYNQRLGGMIERRMRQSIFAIASFWYTAWINAGQPDLSQLTNPIIPGEIKQEMEALSRAWQDRPDSGQEHD